MSDPRRVGWDEMLPDGLCAKRDDHFSHPHESPSLGRFWCTANQDDREPMRSERRRAEGEA